MTVEDVMTRDVITVSPETPIHKAARLMVEHSVSGLPVVHDGRLVGIISEGDLILRLKPHEKKPGWHKFFEDGGRLAREYRKAVGTTVGDVMTRSVVSISPVFGIATAAAILTNRNIRRLPVVRDGQLVGIVSRGDLVKALAASESAMTSRSETETMARAIDRQSPCGLAAAGEAASPPQPRGGERRKQTDKTSDAR